ncbi:MAG: hypothetical protein OXI96_06265 [Acidimicrobiaceae bacterium]|nr:hypothetical protein [Acidimicrobiaceae bacterium]
MINGQALAVLVASVLMVCAACASNRTPQKDSQVSSTIDGNFTTELPASGNKDESTSDSEQESADSQTLTPLESLDGTTIPQPEDSTSKPPTNAPQTIPTTTSQPQVPSTTTAPALKKPEFIRFVDGTAPQWPFHGLVQLWPSHKKSVWLLRFWSWDPPADKEYPQLELSGLRIDCLGQIAMVVHDDRGIEIGGVEGVANGTYWVPWGGVAQRTDAPSQELLEVARTGSSNISVHTEGDWVHIDTGSQMRSYAMRDPIRSDGIRWTSQAQHNGELFLLTVHPAHLPCYSGVTWVSLAATGEFVTCGANSAATTFVLPPEAELQPLVLPDAEAFYPYLSCAPKLNLMTLPFTKERTLISPQS